MTYYFILGAFPLLNFRLKRETFLGLHLLDFIELLVYNIIFECKINDLIEKEKDQNV